MLPCTCTCIVVDIINISGPQRLLDTPIICENRLQQIRLTGHEMRGVVPFFFQLLFLMSTLNQTKSAIFCFGHSEF